MFKYKYFLIALAFAVLCILRIVVADSGTGSTYAVTLI